MAKGNMILTLVAQTKGWASGLKNASRNAMDFGDVVGKAMKFTAGAILAALGALLMFLPNFIKMGEEARKSELRLGNIAKQMGLFGKNTDKVTKSLSKYAEEISFATGVDDELVRSAQAIMLTFKELGKTADDGVGNAFDRATMAAVDLAAAGFGEVETNAKQLGKALQDPIKGLTALRKAGVTFTDGERKKIKALVESGKLLEAQSIILTAIETQVGGTAEATASATDKMNAKWESVQEQLATVLLPAVDDLATAFIEWLDSVEGRTAIANLTKQLEDFGKWIASPDGKEAIDKLVRSLGLMLDTVANLVDMITDLAEAWGFASAQAKNYNSRFYSPNAPRSPGGTPATGVPGSTGGPTTPADRRPMGITVNFNAPVDSVSAGREVARVLNDYNKARGI